MPIDWPWVILFGTLLLISGLWLGLAFPIAGRIGPFSDPVRVAGTLYAADLWGAAVGAVLTSAILVPLIGLMWTLALTSLLLFAAARALPASSL
jgi:hypothetical protein